MPRIRPSHLVTLLLLAVAGVLPPPVSAQEALAVDPETFTLEDVLAATDALPPAEAEEVEEIFRYHERNYTMRTLYSPGCVAVRFLEHEAAAGRTVDAELSVGGNIERPIPTSIYHTCFSEARFRDYIHDRLARIFGPQPAEFGDCVTTRILEAMEAVRERADSAGEDYAHWMNHASWYDRQLTEAKVECDEGSDGDHARVRRDRARDPLRAGSESGPPTPAAVRGALGTLQPPETGASVPGHQNDS